MFVTNSYFKKHVIQLSIPKYSIIISSSGIKSTLAQVTSIRMSHKWQQSQVICIKLTDHLRYHQNCFRCPVHYWKWSCGLIVKIILTNDKPRRVRSFANDSSREIRTIALHFAFMRLGYSYDTISSSELKMHSCNH